MYYNHNIKKKGISDNYLPNYHTRLDMKYPWVVKWNISDKCNLECRHCFRSNALSIISKEDADTIINDMGENGVACVALTGGEPLMNPNLMYIIQRLKEKNIDVEIATNGTLINKKIAKKIYNSGVKKIQISLDGADETSNDMIRGRGAYNNIINGIQILIKSGFFVTIATTLNAKTVHQIDQFIMLKNMLSVSAIRFEIYIPIRKEDLELRLSAEDLNLIKEKKRYYLFDNTVFFPEFGMENNCGAGIYMCVINADNTISPCDLLCDKLRSEQLISAKTSIKDIVMTDKCFVNLDTNFLGCKVAYDIYKELRKEFDEVYK